MRRSRSESIVRLSYRERMRRQAELGPCEHARPLQRGDCLPGGWNCCRPCLFVGCPYHLYLDVNPVNGNIKYNFPDLEPGELPESCALDVAERNENGVTLEEAGALLNLTRERVRQVEALALARLARRAPVLATHAASGRPGPHRAAPSSEPLLAVAPALRRRTAVDVADLLRAGWTQVGLGGCAWRPPGPLRPGAWPLPAGEAAVYARRQMAAREVRA